MVSNPYHFSRLGTTVSAQLTDGVDAPHTGLIKALSVYSTGSYPVKTSTDFNITAASKNTINITSGKVVRDGELQAAITAGSAISIGDTAAGKTYSLVVVNSSNAFAVRTTTTNNIVPEMSNGDIPIAIVLFTDDSSTMEFQYFTNRKESNTLSVAYANSNVYTEILEMKGNAGNVELTGSALTDISSLDSANDRLLVRDATNNQLKLVAPDDVGGGGATADADGDTKIQVEESSDEDKIRFDTAGSERMIIDDSGNVGIGTTAPTNPLHVKQTISSGGDAVYTARFQSTDGNVGFTRYGGIHVNNDNTAPTDGAAWDTDRWQISERDGNQFDIAHGSATDTNVAASDTIMRILSSGKVGINMGSSDPAVELQVSGGIRLSGEIEIDGNLNHDGSNVGFFGTAVASKQTVNNLSATSVIARPAAVPTASPGFEPSVDLYVASLETEIGNLRTKLDALIDALQLYGLIS
tara:strand:+ start:11359 stop:12762 length:1404 start_codon:yes stop_codon:yes gene_type:complete